MISSRHFIKFLASLSECSIRIRKNHFKDIFWNCSKKYSIHKKVGKKAFHNHKLHTIMHKSSPERKKIIQTTTKTQNTSSYKLFNIPKSHWPNVFYNSLHRQPLWSWRPLNFSSFFHIFHFFFSVNFTFILTNDAVPLLPSLSMEYFSMAFYYFLQIEIVETLAIYHFNRKRKREIKYRRNLMHTRSFSISSFLVVLWKHFLLWAS